MKNTIRIENRFECKDSEVVNVLYFRKQHTIVSCNLDGKIRIWDSLTYECKKVLKNANAVCIAKIDNFNFLYSSNDDSIVRSVGFSKDFVCEVEKEFKVGGEDGGDSKIVKIIVPKLHPNLFLCVREDGEIHVFNHKLDAVLSKENLGHFKVAGRFPDGRISIIDSQKFRSSIYVNTILFKNESRDKPLFGGITMFNFLTGKIMKSFDEHDTTHEISILDRTPLIHNNNESVKGRSRQGEALIVGVRNTLYVYNAGKVGFKKLIRKVRLNSSSLFCSSLVLTPKTLLLGSEDGHIVTVDVFSKNSSLNEEEVKTIDILESTRTKVHSGRIKKFSLFSELKHQKLYMRIGTVGSNEKSFCIVCVSYLTGEVSLKCQRYINSRFGKYIKREIDSTIRNRLTTVEKIKKIQYETVKMLLSRHLLVPKHSAEFQPFLNFYTEEHIKKTPNLKLGYRFSGGDDENEDEGEVEEAKDGGGGGGGEKFIYFGEINLINFLPTGFGVIFKRVKSRVKTTTDEKEKKRLRTLIGFRRRKQKKHYLLPLYIGGFLQGKMEGKGDLFNVDLTLKSFERREKDPESAKYWRLYSGTWKRGKKDGKGMMFTEFASMQEYIVYEGQFRRGKREGRGKFYDIENHESVDGIWKEDVLVDDHEGKVTRYKCPIFKYVSIGDYLNTKNLVGSGAFGNVFKVRKTLLPQKVLDLILDDEKKEQRKDDDDDEDDEHQYVAVKVMNCQSRFQRQIMLLTIKRGIELCNRVSDNRNILPVYAIFTSPRSIGYVMKICKYSVAQVISSSQGMLSYGEKKRIILETAEGMKSLHERSIMHRDLKWANVMMDYDDVVQITDFDTLKEDEREWRVHSLKATSRIGTTGFLAPEVFLGKKHLLESDVYAMGLMIYSLLWEQNHPFLTTKMCSCGMSVESIIISNTLEYHVAHHNLRPLLDQQEASKYDDYLVDIMVNSWDGDIYKRPTFSQIVRIMKDESKKKKCYTILQLRFPKHEELKDQAQSLLIVEPKVEKIVNWVETKFQGTKVVDLSHPIFGSLKTDEDVVRLIDKLEHHIINVELRMDDEDRKELLLPTSDMMNDIRKEDGEEMMKKMLLEERKRREECENEVKRLREELEKTKRIIEKLERENNLLKSKM